MLTLRAAAGGAALALAGAAVLVGGSATASAADGPCGTSCGGPTTGGSAGGGSITVTVRGSGVMPGGGSVPIDTSTIAVHPLCWYESFATGKEYAEWIDSGMAHQLEHNLGGEAYEEIPGWEEHKDDDEGHWYGGICSSAYWEDENLDGFFDASEAWFADHPVVWVDAGDAPPDPLVTPEMLAEVAFDAMDLPTGDIRWNPTRAGDDATFVGLDTWVWLEGAPESVDVTASVYGGALWARVDASLAHLDVSAPGASSTRCADGGTPWSAGASSTCSITFERSSANQRVKPGHTVPTSTMTASAVWTAAWVSSLDANPTALPEQTVTTTAEVPVAEIQAVTVGS